MQWDEATNSLIAIREIESVSLSSHYNIIIDYCKNIQKNQSSLLSRS